MSWWGLTVVTVTMVSYKEAALWLKQLFIVMWSNEVYIRVKLELTVSVIPIQDFSIKAFFNHAKLNLVLS